MTTLRIGAASLVGQVRSANEDSYLVTDDLVAVADGMGGHRAGEVASADTVEVLRTAAGSRAIEDLVAAVHRANRRINERAAEDDELRGMGTTVCVVGLVRYDEDDELAVLNVGDSRVYLFADGELTRLTEDHSLVETLVREGRISPEEAEHHPQRNVITRALGVEALVVVDAWLLHPCDGDRVLLCSDGLFGEIGEGRIAELLAEPEEPEVVARRLAAEADAAGGRDNITTVVLDVTDTGSPVASLTGRYRRISTPAVDLSDLDEDGPRTQTVMAVVVGSADVGASDEVLEDDDGPDDAVEDVAEQDAPTVRPSHDGDDEQVERDAEAAEAGFEHEADVSERPSAPESESPGRRADVEDGPDQVDDLGDDGDGDGTVHRGRPWRTALFVLAVAVLIAVMATVLVVWSRSGWVVTERDNAVVLLRGPKNGVLFLGPEEVERFGDLKVDGLTGSQRSTLVRGQSYTNEAKARAFIATLRTPSTTTTTTTTTTSTTTPDTSPPTVAPTAPPTLAP